MKFHTAILSVLLLCLHPGKCLAQGTPSEKHPFLLVTANQVNALKLQIADTTGWRYKSWIRLKKEADQYLDLKLEIPPRGGNWEHYYIGSSGYPLTRGKIIGPWQWEHVDKHTGQIFKGDTSDITRDYDGYTIAQIHNRWALGALQLGLAWQISGQNSYGEKAKTILLAYATLYPTLRLRNRFNTTQTNDNGVGRLHVQNLNEAQWLVDMLQATDLVWEKLSVEEIRKLTDNLLIPATEIILMGRQSGKNIECWRDAAIGMAGLLLHNDKYIQRAVYDPVQGYAGLTKNHIDKDGFWAESTMNYQFYALHALIQLSQAVRNAGHNFDITPLKKMFVAPLLLANNKLKIPALNNSGYTALPNMYYFLYEWAYAKYRDPRFAKEFNPLGRDKFENVGPRFTGWALLFGTDNLPATLPPNNLKSKNFEQVGLAVLSSGNQDNNLTCYMKYHTRKEWHVHPDNLAFAIQKGDEQIAVLSGGSNYISPLYEGWYQHTISSNSFLVDEKPQKRSTARYLSFGTEKKIDYIITESARAYDSTVFTRTVSVLHPNLVLIIDQVKMTGDPKLLDIVIHPAGKWDTINNRELWKSSKPGYKNITDGGILKNVDNQFVSTKLPSGRTVMISAMQEKPFDVISGYGEEFMNNKIPVAIFRRKTNEAIMAWCISSSGEKIKITIEPVKGPSGTPLPLYKVAKLKLTDSRGYQWSIIANPYKIETAEKGESVNLDFAVKTF